jgi:acyl-CoA thioesterase-1
MYGDIAARFQVPLVPFLLERVALNADLMQSDGLHPSAAGEPPVLDTLWPYLAPLLEHGCSH